MLILLRCAFVYQACIVVAKPWDIIILPAWAELLILSCPS
jgi:hypothetical protein